MGEHLCARHCDSPPCLPPLGEVAERSEVGEGPLSHRLRRRQLSQRESQVGEGLAPPESNMQRPRGRGKPLPYIPHDKTHLTGGCHG